MESGVSWQIVRAEALRRIRTREWQPGARIPHEADFAIELGCARATVNRALRALADAGYLVRRRKGGTHVAATPVRKATFEITIIRQDVEERGQEHSYRLLEDRLAAPPAAVKHALKLASDAPWRQLRALHLADNLSFCLEDRWVNPAIVPQEQISFETVSANEWLVRNLTYTGGELAFYAAPADPESAARLGCAPGAALFAIDRTTFIEDEPITAVTLRYAPGHRMRTAL